GLVLRRDGVRPGDDPKGAAACLAQALMERMDRLMEESEELRNFVRRVNLLAKHAPELGIAPLDDAHLREAVLRMCEESPAAIDAPARELRRSLEEHLTYAQQQALREHAPETLTVPTGNRIKLQYQ